MTSVIPNTVDEYVAQTKTLLKGVSVNPENISASLGKALLTQYPRLDGILCTPDRISIDFITNQSAINTEYKIFNVYNAKIIQTSPVLSNTVPRDISVCLYPQPSQYANMLYANPIQGAPSALIVYNDKYTLYPIEANKSYRVDLVVHLSLMKWTETVTDSIISKVPYNNRLVLLYAGAYYLADLLGMGEETIKSMKSKLDKEIANISPIQSMQSNIGGGDVIGSRYGSYITNYNLLS